MKKTVVREQGRPFYSVERRGRSWWVERKKGGRRGQAYIDFGALAVFSQFFVYVSLDQHPSHWLTVLASG